MTQTPGSTHKESLSALVDGESNDLDLQRVLSAMDKDDELRESWSRYQTIGTVMRNEHQQLDMTIDLSSAIRDAIADETPEVAATSTKTGLSSLWSGLGKTAIAATVAFGVVFSVQNYSTNDDLSNPAVAENTTEAEANGAVVPQGFELPPLSAQTVSTNTFVPQQKALPKSSVSANADNGELKNEVNRLLYKHAQESSANSGIGAIPLSRVSEVDEETKD